MSEQQAKREDVATTRDAAIAERSAQGMEPATFNYEDPTPEMLTDPIWTAIWNEVKTWDINVPTEYGGYKGATGNHATAIFKALRAASTPEAAGRGDDRLMHELWVQGSRFETELRGALFLHPENWYAPALQQQLEQWDAIAGRYAQRFAAPPSAEQGAVPEPKD